MFPDYFASANPAYPTIPFWSAIPPVMHLFKIFLNIKITLSRLCREAKQWGCNGRTTKEKEDHGGESADDHRTRYERELKT